MHTHQERGSSRQVIRRGNDTIRAGAYGTKQRMCTCGRSNLEKKEEPRHARARETKYVVAHTHQEQRGNEEGSSYGAVGWTTPTKRARERIRNMGMAGWMDRGHSQDMAKQGNACMGMRGVRCCASVWDA